MVSQDVETPLATTAVEKTASPTAAAVDDVAEAVAKVSLQDEATPDNASDTPPRALKVYTRHVLLHISKSPLVSLPEAMPALKDWFGDWNEQVGSKKESESSTTTNARERRFRKDADDGDSARPSFRSGLSQPSQMGNFRHQSIRTTERNGDKDNDRERERDIRDREGQERLRNLSDKYDRDRLALSSASNLRNKERDAAPHLTGASASRLGQSQGAGRRGEGRDAPKRKAGESSDDWRRGAEPNRAGRDDRTDSRRDRDRPRSRVRDSSRPRRESSTTRRDRDREDRDRPRDRRGDPDRDDRRDWDDRRDRDDYPRRDRDDGFDRDRFDYGRRTRDRDLDRDTDEDPRRWRDDGRRDERMAARREREARERGWDRPEERDRERPSERDERDTTRRRIGRDRKINDDNRDREDRRDRDKEAEPAWMETYIPTTPGGGILGGKGADGELDSIQAWKKGMKEKERKEKGEPNPDSAKVVDTNGTSDHQAPNSNAEGGMDEIQLFKLMMKREAEKKEGEKSQNGLHNHVLAEAGPPGLSASPSLQSQKGDATSDSAQRSDVPKATLQERTSLSPHPETATGHQPTLTPGDSSRPSQSSSPSLDRSAETSRVVGPRLGQAPSGAPPSSGSLNALPPVDLSIPNPSSSANAFNPPPGSRVLALKSRVSSGGLNGPPGMTQLPPPGITSPHGHPSTPGSSGVPPHLADAVPNDMSYGGPRINPSESSRGIRSFSPLSNGPQQHVSLEDMREAAHLSQMNEGIRRASGSSAAERAILGLSGEAGSMYSELSGPQAGGFPPGMGLDPSGSNVPGGANYASNKGSRFAKFFDNKTRDGQAAGPRLVQQVPGMAPPVPHPNQRQESISLGGLGGPRGERTMEDIFAMLQSSAQGHRASPQIPQSGRIPSGGNQFAQSNLELQLLQQQQQQLHHQQIAQNRLDALYESRLDDRFVPDGLVPGLRPAPPRSRSRESGGVLFNEQIDDPLHFNVQRLTQQRNMEQMYNAPVPSLYNQQAAMLRNGGHPMQQGQFRGASPQNVNVLQPPSQRLPPGLANLGGRPPHDPSQYLGAGVGVGVGVGGIPGGGLHGASPAQQVYNTFTQGGLGFNGNGPVRGPPGPQNPLSVGAMGGGLGPTNLDLRAANQAQLLGLAQGGVGGGMRGAGPGGYGPQHGPGGQMSQAALRQLHHQQQQQQQQQQHIPPHMVPHLLQQQGLGQNAQATQDLMALLMGGHRE